ncbi:diaminopimelate epimerase [bacterium]|nr:diaminopimelate epimerase [bacterium]
MINLSKMQAAGNDFVVVNDMRRSLRGLSAFARKLCHRNYGVGADGVILLQPSGKRRSGVSYRMRIINSDGSEAEMCGNGARCAVKFAVEHRIAPRTHWFETLAGLVEGKYISPSRVQVSLTPPVGFESRLTLRLPGGRRVVGSFVNTGVPHFVTFVSRVAAVDVISVGKQIRTHQRFAPRGTNVNFVEIERRGRRPRLQVRTYERGVESETLACGTGATASAVIAALDRGLRPPIDVMTSGGAVLRIDFSGSTGASAVTGVRMTGPAENVFETRMTQ